MPRTIDPERERRNLRHFCIRQTEKCLDANNIHGAMFYALTLAKLREDYMGKTTGITWTHSTFNGWIGCTHAPLADGSTNPLCDCCYAERENGHWKWNGGLWGPGAPRKLTSINYWNEPFRWDKQAAASGEPWRVFAFSLADVFDVEAPAWPEDRQLPGLGACDTIRDLFSSGFSSRSELSMPARVIFFREVVDKTPNLTWLILTKRYEQAAELLRFMYGARVPRNIWVIFSAGTQQTLNEAMLWLPQIDASVRGISAEPLLGDMDFRPYFERKQIDWVITGGESGPKARKMDLAWEATIRYQCGDYGVAYFLKQLGTALAAELGITGAGADPSKWAKDWRVQEFPEVRR